MKTKLLVAAAVAASVLFGIGYAQDDSSYEPVPYPEGYRDWRHVKSMLIEPGHPLYSSFGGIHHLYANDAALQGYALGEFPDGSVIAFDLLEAQSAEHAIVEGERKIVGVMMKDIARWPQTKGWGFEGFKGDSKTERAVAEQAASACFACHTSQSEHDYVFSRSRP